MDRLNFSSGSPLNTLADYEWLSASGLALSEAGRDVDQLDQAFWRKTHSKFSLINSSERMLQIWGCACVSVWTKVDAAALPILSDYDKSWPNRHMSCTALIAKTIFTFSDRKPSPPWLALFLNKCRELDLLFRGSFLKLGSLFKDMEDLSDDELDPFQNAPDPGDIVGEMPRPPKSCWTDHRNWSYEDWPREHGSSWCYFLTFCRGLIGNTPITFSVNKGVTERPLLSQLWKRGNWEGLWERAKTIALNYLSENPYYHLPSGFSMGGTRSEFFFALQPSSVSILCNFVKAGIPPDAVLDTSEFATGEETRWERGARSVHYVALIQFACRFGPREVLAAFMQDRERFRCLDDTAVLWREVVNNPRPSILIELYEEILQDPEGRLADEVYYWCSMQQGLSWVPFSFGQLREEWRYFLQNNFMLACVTGDMVLAKYLVEGAVKLAERHCSSEKTAERRIMVAASYVNKPSRFHGPKGSPLEVAIRFGHLELVEYLCSMGAVVKLEREIEVAGQIADQIRLVMTRWGVVQAKTRETIENLRTGANARQINEMAAALAVYRSQSAIEKKTIEYASDVVGRIEKTLAESSQLLEALEGELIFIKTLVEFYGSNHSVDGRSSGFSYGARDDLRSLA